MASRTRIIRVGNSRGIRIPKPLLEQSGLEDEVELVVEVNKIIIQPAERPRRGWDEALEEMSVNEDDRLPDDASGGTGMVPAGAVPGWWRENAIPSRKSRQEGH